MLVLWMASAMAATLTVGGSGSYSSIQDAVDDAQSGDTIVVSSGSYAEKVSISGLDLTVTGSGSTQVEVNPTYTGTVFTIDVSGGETVSISGFTIVPTTGRGIEVRGEGLVELSDLVIDSPGVLSTHDGAGIRIREAEAFVSMVEITDARGRFGGGFYVGSGADVVLTDVTIDAPEAVKGGGLYIDGATVELVRVEVTGPHTDYAGGGLHVEDSDLTGEDVVITDPTGDDTPGVGLYLASDAVVDLTGLEVSGAAANVSGYSGGGLYADERVLLTLTDSTFSDNYAEYGGAMFLRTDVIASFDNVVFQDNIAESGGGAIWATREAVLGLDGCSFEGNTATLGGAVAVKGGASLVDGSSGVGSEWTDNQASDGDGGALYADGADEISLTGATFTGNTATSDGGAVYVSDLEQALVLAACTLSTNTADSGDGGAVYVGSATGAELSTCELSDNQAGGDGGALSLAPGDDDQDYTLEALTLSGNHADDDGGAVSAYRIAALALTDLDCQDNGADGSGGCVFVDRAADVTVVRGLLFKNAAGADGGALYVETLTGDLELTNLSVVENTALDDGAGFFLSDLTDGWVVNNTLLANDATSEGAHAFLESCTVSFINNIAHEGQDGGGVVGDSTVAAGSDFFYNDVVDNAGGDWGGSLSDPAGTSGNIDDDPELRDYSLDGDSTNDDLHLTLDSPCLDAGYPSITDVDGSVSDIGAYGGPEADVQDADEDGFYDSTDCNDGDADIYPGAEEVPYDGVDQDCDGSDLADLDEDGWPWAEGDTGDCDDEDPEVHPGAEETWYDGVDQDCDEWSDYDQDFDGSDAEAYGGDDCDDTDPLVGPDVEETWYDGIDQDCDDADDYDQDGDGWRPEAYGGTDCDDTDPTSYPGATEVPYDGADNDCAGDGDLTDVDGDGVDAVEVGGADCDDTDPTVKPGADETWYDGVDQDCDGADDYDQDGDGHAWEAYGGGDCDDTDPMIGPHVTETWYDGIDSDCDDASDYDRDGDGYDSDQYGGLDCDDLDPTKYPDAEELLNGEDDDCDGWAEDDDRDGDGLVDWDEWQLGTDVNNPDSDGDSLLDGEEVDDPDVPTDSDEDGDIDPLDYDDDDDGIPTLIETSVDVDDDGWVDLDVDDDGVPNHLDLDADDDSYPDAEEGTADLDLDGIPDFVDYTGELASGGCHGGKSGLFLPLLLVLGRRRWGWLGLLATGPAMAQGMDVTGLELQDATGDPRRPLRLSWPDAGKLGDGGGAIVTSLSGAPLVEILPTGREPIIGTLTTATAVGSVSLSRWGRVDVSVPVHLFGSTAQGGFTAMGDVRLGGAFVALEPSRLRPGIALSPMVWVPTGDETHYVGSPTVAGGGVVSVAQELGRFSWVANLGARVSPAGSVRNLSPGSGWLLGVAGTAELTPNLGASLEVTSQGAGGWDQLPLEVTLGSRYRHNSGIWVTAGASAGLTDGIGAPAWRAMVGVGWGRSSAGWEVLPDIPVAVVPEPTADQLNFDLDRDGDGVPDALDDCPDLFGVEALGGCPAEVLPPVQLGNPLATLEDDRIVIHESIFFEEGRARILKRSDPVLQAVFDILLAHPELEYILVEGHTNDNGPMDYNLRLSEQRAQAVVHWLVKAGVDPMRLLFKGYGFNKPLVPHGSEESSRVNRRVEFTVLKPDELPSDWRFPDPDELPAF